MDSLFPSKTELAVLATHTDSITSPSKLNPTCNQRNYTPYHSLALSLSFHPVKQARGKSALGQKPFTTSKNLLPTNYTLNCSTCNPTPPNLTCFEIGIPATTFLTSLYRNPLALLLVTVVLTMGKSEKNVRSFFQVRKQSRAFLHLCCVRAVVQELLVQRRKYRVGSERGNNMICLLICSNNILLSSASAKWWSTLKRLEFDSRKVIDRVPQFQ